MTKNEYIFLRNNVINNIRISKIKYYENLFNKIKTDSKQTYETINTILNGQQQKNKFELKSVVFNDITYKDSSSMTTIFEHHFLYKIRHLSFLYKENGRTAKLFLRMATNLSLKFD